MEKMKKARLQERKALINGYNLYIVYYKELLPVKERQSRTHLSVTWTIVFDFVRFGAVFVLLFWFPPYNFFGRYFSRTACGFRRSRSPFGQGKCPHSPRPYKALSMLCLTGNSPSAEHTTFKESIVCYTLQAFYKVLLAVCFRSRRVVMMIIFHFYFLLLICFLGRKKVADKNTTDLKGQKIRTNQNTLKAFLLRTD